MTMLLSAQQAQNTADSLCVQLGVEELLGAPNPTVEPPRHPIISTWAHRDPQKIMIKDQNLKRGAEKDV